MQKTIAAAQQEAAAADAKVDAVKSGGQAAIRQEVTEIKSPLGRKMGGLQQRARAQFYRNWEGGPSGRFRGNNCSRLFRVLYFLLHQCILASCEQASTSLIVFDFDHALRKYTKYQ